MQPFLNKFKSNATNIDSYFWSFSTQTLCLVLLCRAATILDWNTTPLIPTLHLKPCHEIHGSTTIKR